MSGFIDFLQNTGHGWPLILVVFACLYALAVLFSYGLWQAVALYNHLHYDAIHEKFLEEYQRNLKRLQRQEEDEAEVVFLELQEFLTEADIRQKRMN